MKKSIILLAIALGCFGCQTNHNNVAKAPADTMVIDSVTREPGKRDMDVIKGGLSVLSKEELLDFGIIGLTAKGSLNWQCRLIKDAFGAKVYNRRPLPKTFLLSGDDEKAFEDIINCAFADQQYNLTGYKVIYVGSESSFDFIVNKLKPTGIVVVTKEYEAKI